MTALQAAGLSHSETPASMVICTSAGIIAAYRVLHRLREPRHPPCALYYFLRCPQHPTPKAGADAHTFSCIVEKTLSNLQSCLSNMSKIDRAEEKRLCRLKDWLRLSQRLCRFKDWLRLSQRLCRFKDWLRLSSSAQEWRITDSNR